jgi:hypothetical protein
MLLSEEEFEALCRELSPTLTINRAAVRLALSCAEQFHDEPRDEPLALLYGVARHVRALPAGELDAGVLVVMKQANKSHVQIHAAPEELRDALERVASGTWEYVDLRRALRSRVAA